MKFVRALPIILLAGLALHQPGLAQEAVGVWNVRTTPSGWIGIRFGYQSARVDGEIRTVVVVGEVIQDSPAQAAGLVAGDTLIALDGQGVSPDAFLAMSRTLEPGDLVPLTVLRDGRPAELLVEAAAPPEGVILGPDADEVMIQLEALSGRIMRNLDSLRLSIAPAEKSTEQGDLSVHVLRMPADARTGEGRVTYEFSFQSPFSDSLHMQSGEAFFSPESAVPFQALVVGSRATRDLQDQLMRVRKDLTSLRRQELDRRQELAASNQGSVEEALRRDSRMQEIREKESQLVAKQQELAESLRRVSEQELQKQWVTIQSRNEEALLTTRERENEAREESRRRWIEGQEQDRFRRDYPAVEYTSPLLMGQNFIMGAQLMALTPDLAQYFATDEGIFVVQVVEGTPASEAGLQGGDIIVTIGGEDVTSLSDLRFGLGAAPGPYKLRVVRKDGPVEILIRR